MRESSGWIMKSPPQSTVVLFISALWISWSFGYRTVWQRFAAEVDGVVISSRDVPSKGVTEYVVQDASGTDHRYVAGVTDASLERSLPVGTEIRKEWGSLDYAVNGKKIRFPTYFYSAVCGVALVSLLWGAVLWRLASKKE
ncbi:MAG: hypothetical protein WCA26_04415 [Xanthobacteraceae bacterium]